MCTSSDSGASWMQTGLPESVVYQAVALSGTGQFMYACENVGGLYLSWDFGATWQKSSTSQYLFYDMDTDETGQYVITADGKYTLTSFDYGVSFNRSEIPMIASKVAASDTLGQYAVVAGSSDITITSNYGYNWTKTGPYGQWTGVTSDATGKYMVGVEYYSSHQDGCIYASSDFGATWTLSELNDIESI